MRVRLSYSDVLEALASRNGTSASEELHRAIRELARREKLWDVTAGND